MFNRSVQSIVSYFPQGAVGLVLGWSFLQCFFFLNVLENSKLQKRLKELSMDGTEEGERRKFYDQLDLGFHDP